MKKVLILLLLASCKSNPLMWTTAIGGFKILSKEAVKVVIAELDDDPTEPEYYILIDGKVFRLLSPPAGESMAQFQCPHCGLCFFIYPSAKHPGTPATLCCPYCRHVVGVLDARTFKP